jgi:hypothetical protein
MNFYKLGEMNADTMLKVVNFFADNCAGTANDIGASGSFMKSLCDRCVAKVIGKNECFVKIGDNLYKKDFVNIYALNISACELWKIFISRAEQTANEKKSIAEEHIAKAKARLTEAEKLLSLIK